MGLVWDTLNILNTLIPIRIFIKTGPFQKVLKTVPFVPFCFTARD